MDPKGMLCTAATTINDAAGLIDKNKSQTGGRCT
jgi:hypothetical protein